MIKVLTILHCFCAALFATTISYSGEIETTKISAEELIETPVVGGGYAGKAFSVSPDHSAIAFQVVTPNVQANDYAIEWYVLELNTDASPRLVAEGGDVMLNIRQRVVTNGVIPGSTPKWSPDGKWIAFARQDGDEIQLWRASRDGKRQEQLTHNEGNVFGSTRYDALFEWSADGTKLFYEVARPRRAMDRAMAEEGARGFLFDDRFHPYAAYTPFWTRCGESRIGSAPSQKQACNPVLWVHEIRDGADRVASSEEIAEYDRIKTHHYLFNYNAVATVKRIATDDNGRTAVLENIDPDIYLGFEPPVHIVLTESDRNRRTCAHDICSSSLLEDLWLIEGEVIFLRREGETGIEKFGRWAFYGWDPESDNIRQILKTTDYYFECAAASAGLICYHESPTTPRRVVQLDTKTGETKSLFDPGKALGAKLTARVEHLEIENAQGAVAYAKLVYPARYEEGRRYPLVIVQGHHRGFLQGGTGNEYPVYLLAQEGFFVLNASPFHNISVFERLRGAELAKVEFENAQRRKSALSAYRQYIEILDGRGLIDSARVGITGLSSGSSNARYGVMHSDLFATAVMSTGYSGPQQYWFNPAAWRKSMLNDYGGALPFEPAAEDFMAQDQLGWRAQTTLFPPLLWQVSDSELSHALFDHNLLFDEGHPVEMYVYPNAFHVKHQPLHRYNVYRRNVQWMQYWLQGKRAPDPMDNEQYDRWDGLCKRYLAQSKRFSGASMNKRVFSSCARSDVK